MRCSSSRSIPVLSTRLWYSRICGAQPASVHGTTMSVPAQAAGLVPITGMSLIPRTLQMISYSIHEDMPEWAWVKLMARAPCTCAA
jgi:hypothetical protein